MPRLGYSTLGESKSGVTGCCREVFFSRGLGVNGATIQCNYTPYESLAVGEGMCAVEETGKRSFQGTWEGLVKIARYEGVSSLWRGLSPTLYRLVQAFI
jgi:solute carrier family 25, member 39/40